jgi:hypothetical protein
MQFFTGQNSITGIKRQVYLLGKSSYVLAATSTATGYLRPLNEEQAAANGVQYGLGFSLIVECSVDIQEGDKFTIGSDNYTVRGVVNHNRGGLTAYKRCLLLKGQGA